jgi:hypothetical protein
MPITMSARDRLAWTIAGEAGRESRAGQDAVAHNILNRYYSGRYGSSIEGVIMSPGQYSMWNDVTGYAGGSGGNSGSLMRNTSPERFSYFQGVADDAMTGRTSDPTGGSLNYYNPDIASPSWGVGSSGWIGTGTIGGHTFGVSGGRSPYDFSNPLDPRGSGGYRPPYENFSPSGYDYSGDTAPGSFADYGAGYTPPYNQFSNTNVSEDVKNGSFNDFLPGGRTATEDDGTTHAPQAPPEEERYLTGENVSQPNAGPQGTAGSVPIAIVTAANQEAKAAASSAKTVAEATLKATQTQTASDAKLQGSQQSWASNWAVRIFLFIVGAIFIAGGLFLFGGQTIFQQKQA